jgi:hypothetical protein
MADHHHRQPVERDRSVHLGRPGRQCRGGFVFSGGGASGGGPAFVFFSTQNLGTGAKYAAKIQTSGIGSNGIYAPSVGGFAGNGGGGGFFVGNGGSALSGGPGGKVTVTVDDPFGIGSISTTGEYSNAIFAQSVGGGGGSAGGAGAAGVIGGTLTGALGAVDYAGGTGNSLLNNGTIKSTAGYNGFAVYSGGLPPSIINNGTINGKVGGGGATAFTNNAGGDLRQWQQRQSRQRNTHQQWNHFAIGTRNGRHHRVQRQLRADSGRAASG